jgi:hypothetical protein
MRQAFLLRVAAVSLGALLSPRGRSERLNLANQMRWSRVAAIAFTLLLASYLALGLCLENAPMQDLPDHVMRAHIIGDLLFRHGAQFGDLFVFKRNFSPYLGGDLVLASLDWFLGTAWASRVWIALAIGLLPLSVWFALRRQGADSFVASAAGILALFVATDRFFIFGFMNFLFSVACAFFTYGWLCSAARTGRARAYTLYVLLLVVSYVVHLTALIFLTAIAGLSLAIWSVRRELSLRRAALLMLPPLLLVVFQLVTAPALDLIGQAMHSASEATRLGGHAGLWWHAMHSKLIGLAFPAQRFNLTGDIVLLGVLIAATVIPILYAGRTALGVCAEALLLGLALGFSYAIAPDTIGGVFYAGVRPLQYVYVFLIIAGVLAARHYPRVQRAQLVVAVVLAIANLAWVAIYMLPANAALGRYKALTASIPYEARVLPIDTLAFEHYRPFLHAGAYATLSAHAVTPYVFAADNVPNMPYFVFPRRPPYAPHESWYAFHWKVSWEQVADGYQYLLVTVPWATGRIRVPYVVVARNQSAALLKIEGKDHDGPQLTGP